MVVKLDRLQELKRKPGFGRTFDLGALIRERPVLGAISALVNRPVHYLCWLVRGHRFTTFRAERPAVS